MSLPASRFANVFTYSLAAAVALAMAAPGWGDQVVRIDPASATRTFDGYGAVSGGGATTVLLKDYPEPQRSQILDILFKPHFAASMNTLYVEVGGDGNSTQGTEQSHARSRKDLNFYRGYEWWLMEEAKKRNPAITLDACAWSAPGWVGDGDFYSQDMCDYYVSWIKGLESVHHLTLDAIGCRNERGAVEGFAKMLKRTLVSNGLGAVKLHGFDNPGEWKWDWCKDLQKDAELRDAVDIISNHTLPDVPAPESVKALADKYHKPIWNTEEHVYNEAGRNYPDSFDCALGAIHLFNENFIGSHATKVVNWYLEGSTYSIEPYAEQPPALFARSPWSGHYEVKPIVWSYAHVNQFVDLGWKYVASACGQLNDGGSFVTLKSPGDGQDFSVIIETAAAKGPQTLTIAIPPALSSHDLCVWRTTRAAAFERQTDLHPNNGTVTITLEPGALYSLSTTTGQQKGEFADVPADKPFPLPYREDFESYGDARQWGYLPHYTADICGVFELAERADHKGHCLRQVLNQKSQSWAPEWMPYTVLGDANWTDYEVAADVLPDYGGWAGVMGRVSNTGNGWDGDPDGYYVRLYPDGGVALYVASSQLKGNRDKQLAVGSVPGWKGDQWHNVKLRFKGSTITAIVDGKEVVSATDQTLTHGLAGLVCCGENNARVPACYDNLAITPVGEAAASPTPPHAFVPMYKVPSN